MAAMEKDYQRLNLLRANKFNGQNWVFNLIIIKFYVRLYSYIDRAQACTHLFKTISVF